MGERAVDAEIARSSARPMRTDARRNYDRLLSEAADAFAAYGTGASLEEIARRAGVGIGTLYRHFPTREALLDAVFRGHFDELCAEAEELSRTRPPMDALTAWLRAFTARLTRYRGVADELAGPLQRQDSAAYASCHAMRDASVGLITRAQHSGDVRPGIAPGDVLSLAAGVAWVAERTGADPAERADALLSLMIDGIRVPG